MCRLQSANRICHPERARKGEPKDPKHWIIRRLKSFDAGFVP